MFPVVDDTTGRLKFTGRSRALVLSNNDPDQKGRIRVRHLLMGDSDWIPYLNVPGSFFIPKKDDIVYLECDAGYETHMIAWGNINKGVDEGSLTELPEEFKRPYANNQGFYTKGKHLIEFDDGTVDPITGTALPTGDKKGIRITSSEKNKIEIKDEAMDKSLIFTGSNGVEFKIDATNDAITGRVVFGDSFELSKANGFQVSTPAAGGTSLSMKGGKLDLTCNLDGTFTSSTGSLSFQGSGQAQLKLTSGKVALGSSSAELLDLIEQQLGAFIDNASSFGLSSVGPVQISPAVVATLTQIKTLLGTIKGSL